MNNKTKNIVNVILMGLILFGFFVICLVKPAGEYSDSERRPLAQFPELNGETIFGGKFMTAFEDYTVDQFPFRDSFRALKSWTAFYAMGQLDNNDIYIYDDYIAKVEYPLNKDSVTSAGSKFRAIYDKYLADTDCNVYISVIPDKNIYLSEESGRLALDYKELVNILTAATPGMEYIDISDLLEYKDFYRTDTHWRQERIFDVAQRLAEKMGVTLDTVYGISNATEDFKGVYMGQVSLPMESDSMDYVYNPYFDDVVVYNGETDSEMEMYTEEKLTDRDPYEYFLGGSLSYITMTNPNAETDKELIIFRDSFGSAIAPYFTEAYAKVTVVDIRYLHSTMLRNFITYDDQDVLFLYSTLVLNNSETIKG